ncbi:MAG TPA: nucleoside deaminase [Longimicrobiaceae bacterium]
MRENDEKFLREAIRLAGEARASGNQPFGAILIGPDGSVLGEGRNTAATTGDPTGHAEINLVREACPGIDHTLLAGAVMYASAEPCPMCAGAIFWSGIGRLVYGAGSRKVYALLGEPPDQFRLSCREVLWSGRRRVQVDGPLLEDEALEVFAGYRNDDTVRRNR